MDATEDVVKVGDCVESRFEGKFKVYAQDKYGFLLRSEAGKRYNLPYDYSMQASGFRLIDCREVTIPPLPDIQKGDVVKVPSGEHGIVLSVDPVTLEVKVQLGISERLRRQFPGAEITGYSWPDIYELKKVQL